MAGDPDIHVSAEGNIIRVGDGQGGGLYNLVFGRNEAAMILVDLLHSRQPVEVGRLRDAWVERHSDILLIRVLTRNGGDNRTDQADAIASMRAHPWYDHDADQQYDSTYADFYFRPQLDSPEFTDTPEILVILGRIAVEPVDQDQRWRDAIGKLETEGPSPAVAAAFGKMFDAMGIGPKEPE